MRNNPLFKAFIGLFMVLSFSSCEKSNKNVLIIGTSGDNPPFEFYKDGELTGFDIELGKAIAHKMGKTPQFIDMPFDSLIAAIHAKKVDMVISAVTPTDDRKKAVDFSQEYHSTESVLITAGLTVVDTVQHLAEQTVGVQLGSTYEDYSKRILLKHVPTVQIRSLGKLTDVIQELKTGRIAGLITGIAEADSIIEQNPSFKALKLPEGSSSEAIAFPKGSRLVGIVDDALTTLSADQSLQNLKKKWKLS